MSCVAGINPQSYIVKKSHRKKGKYPYEQEGVVVLGPDVAATRDGEYINWRGVFYKRMEPVANPDPYEEYK